MFIKDSKKLPSNVIWIAEDKAKDILNYFPEISRRISDNGYTQIAFIDSQELKDKMNELKIS